MFLDISLQFVVNFLLSFFLNERLRNASFLVVDGERIILDPGLNNDDKIPP